MHTIHGRHVLCGCEAEGCRGDNHLRSFVGTAGQEQAKFNSTPCFIAKLSHNRACVCEDDGLRAKQWFGVDRGIYTRFTGPPPARLAALSRALYPS